MCVNKNKKWNSKSINLNTEELILSYLKNRIVKSQEKWQSLRDTGDTINWTSADIKGL
jgi:uncharacterized membrane protein YvbJ